MRSLAENRLLNDLGDRVRTRRLAKGMTQEELSWSLGVGRTSVVNIESGAYGLSLEVLMRLCKALDCTPDDLLI